MGAIIWSPSCDTMFLRCLDSANLSTHTVSIFEAKVLNPVVFVKYLDLTRPTKGTRSCSSVPSMKTLERLQPISLQDLSQTSGTIYIV